MALTLIGLEEHFAGQAVMNRPSVKVMPDGMFPKSVYMNLADLGDGRINNMDRGNMSIQVISHLPVVEPIEICGAVNDQLFDAVKNSQGRYRGFACLPMATPTEIAGELKRCVETLGFVGALIPNHAHGTYYDGQSYWPMWDMAQELDVPIYIHPTPAEDFDRYRGNYDHMVQTLIAGPALCWHTDIAMHTLRLYGSGVFDAYPRLKVVLGHNGEALPFMLDRIEKMFSRKWGKGKRDWMTVWNENIWITTSGMFHLGPLQCCLTMCKPDRVMYSLDYPFESQEEGLEFMQQLQKSGLVSPEQFEMICSGNARKLLRI